MHVARLGEGGSLDTGFGRSGELFVDDVTGGVGVGAVVPLSNGRIYVVGSGSSGKAFALRLLPSGKLDRGYGRRGVAHMGLSFREVAGAAVDKAGRLLVFGAGAGESSRRPRSGSNRLTVLRRLSSGRPDPTFAAGSFVRLRSLGPAEVVAGGIQDGRKLVVFGASGSCVRICPAAKNFLIRFLGGTSATRCQGRRATIVGTRHGEKMIGTRGPDVIAGLAGNDLVKGRGGDDLICGGSGRDRLDGGSGHNHIAQ